MTWNEYNLVLQQLIKRFSESYTPDDIKKAWFYWKSKSKSELIQFVDSCISSNTPRPLVDLNKKLPSREIYKHEDNSANISDDALNKLLKENNVTSLTELVFRKRNK